jgi:hypothetical protein
VARRPEVLLAPLFTSEEGGSALVSSDTWPGTGGVLGLTKAQIANARAEGIKPAGGAGFAYMRGPGPDCRRRRRRGASGTIAGRRTALPGARG